MMKTRACVLLRPSILLSKLNGNHTDQQVMNEFCGVSDWSYLWTSVSL